MNATQTQKAQRYVLQARKYTSRAPVGLPVEFATLHDAYYAAGKFNRMHSDGGADRVMAYVTTPYFGGPV